MPNGVEQEVTRTLSFECCVCGGPMGVTVRCCGPADAGSAVATVPCPGCGQVNQLFFDPVGEVRSVQPFRCFRPLPTPSVN